jgi:hypothetical protein
MPWRRFCMCECHGDVFAGSKRLHNVLQKGVVCVGPLSWQHANHCISHSIQQTKATLEVAKRQITGDSLHFAVAASS